MGYWGIATGVIGSAELADGSIVAIDLADGAVTTCKLANDAVTDMKLAPDAVQTVNIADNAIVAAHIGTGQVFGVHISDGQVGEAKIADGSITGAKIASGSFNFPFGADVSVCSTFYACYDAYVYGSLYSDGDVQLWSGAMDLLTACGLLLPCYAWGCGANYEYNGSLRWNEESKVVEVYCDGSWWSL